MKANILDLVKGNKTAELILSSATTKKGEISNYKLRIEANKAYVNAMNEDFKSFSALQNFCRNINNKEFTELTDKNGAKIGEDNFNEDSTYIKKVATWLKLKSLDIETDEILFSHITTFGTEKELNNKDGAKVFLSLSFFFVCLERYTAQKSNKTEIETILEQKPETEQKPVDRTNKNQNLELAA